MSYVNYLNVNFYFDLLIVSGIVRECVFMVPTTLQQGIDTE